MIDDNEAVKEGQVLVTHARDYQARVDQAEAALALAEARARGAGVGVPLTQETTDSSSSGADAQLAAAQQSTTRLSLPTKLFSARSSFVHASPHFSPGLAAVHGEPG